MSTTFIDDHNDSLETTRRHFLESIKFPIIAIVAIWLVHIYQYYDGFDAGAFGIMSRRVWGLRGIVTGPLVHGSWGHLASNSLPLLVLTFINIYFYKKVAMQAFWMIYFCTGIAVWFFARPVSHIGASGVIYGLVSFIFWNGIFRGSVRSMILAAIVMLLYSGMFMGVLPDQEGISWESHLIGSIVGIFAAYVFKSDLEDDEKKEKHDPFAAERDREKLPFLSADVFEKTKQQRAYEAAESERIRQESEQNQFFNGYWHY
jgi:membrane associated rhomboid family serine protease